MTVGLLTIRRDGVVMHRERMTLGRVMAWLGDLLKQAAYTPHPSADRWEFIGTDGRYVVTFVSSR